jgi:hypothetical protein
MKNLIKKTLELVYSAKVYANHTSIKGRKSGGNRDNNGKDWKNGNGTNAES